MLNFPLQLIPEKDKTEAWHRLHVDVFVNALGTSNSRYAANKEDEFKNFRTYNGISEPHLKQYITAPNGRLVNMKYEVWPLARQKVRQLVSDFMSRPIKKLKIEKKNIN